MRKNMTNQIATRQTHSRNPSLQKQRNSHPRLTIQPTLPFPQRNTTAHYLSNPNSLQKKKPKAVRKKPVKPKKKREQPTRQTIQSSSQQPWKEHLKLTFHSKHQQSKQLSLHNSSLKCMEEICQFSMRKPAQSYTCLVSTFPKHDGQSSLLGHRERVLLIDWLSFVSSELLLRRNTLHLAVAMIDTLIDLKKQVPGKLQALGAGALLLAVKQEERGTEVDVLATLSGNGSGLTREQIIAVQSSIVLGLNFKLNLGILPFWCDYFSQKWDSFVNSLSSKNNHNLQYEYGHFKQHLATIRNAQGLCYKYYRQTLQLIDTFLMVPNHRQFEQPKLALAALYLVIRIQSEAAITATDSCQQFAQYFTGFGKKASPIFKDRWGFNAIFNQFTAEVCNFQLTELIPAIKWSAQFLDIKFQYQIDSRAYESSQNYQEFLRFSNYSQQIRDHFLKSM